MGVADENVIFECHDATRAFRVDGGRFRSVRHVVDPITLDYERILDCLPDVKSRRNGHNIPPIDESIKLCLLQQ